MRVQSCRSRKAGCAFVVGCGFRSGKLRTKMFSDLPPKADIAIDGTGMSALCRYCCKSPKLPGDNFPAVRRFDRRPPIYVVSITLPRPPVSLSSGDEVPHIFTRKSRLQPGEFSITSAKRLLQQYLPEADIADRQPPRLRETPLAGRSPLARRAGS